MVSAGLNIRGRSSALVRKHRWLPMGFWRLIRDCGRLGMAADKERDRAQAAQPETVKSCSAQLVSPE